MPSDTKNIYVVLGIFIEILNSNSLIKTQIFFPQIVKAQVYQNCVEIICYNNQTFKKLCYSIYSCLIMILKKEVSI